MKTKSMFQPRSFSCLSLCVASMALAGLHAGASTVSQSASVPTANVLLASNTTPHATGNMQFNKTQNQDRFGGVAFDLGHASNVDAISFYVHEVGSGAAGAAASISFVSFNSLAADSITYPYTAVYTEQFVLPALTANQFVTFSFTAPVSLQAGTYGVVFSWLEAGQGQTINFRATNTGSSALEFRTTVDANGSATSVGGMGGNRELLFMIQGSTIPEPSTYGAILGGAAMVLVVTARRGRRFSGSRRD